MDSILSTKCSFLEVFKYDRALIGIVLGYGVQNSLYASRSENICCDLIHAGDLPPFTPYIHLYPDAYSPLTTEDSDAINRLLWGIYFNNPV